MGKVEILDQLLDGFSFKPTKDQSHLLGGLSDFLDSRNQEQLYVVKGYAGTGKTTLVKSIVHFLDHDDRLYVLLAPTGRAAKVLSNYSDKRAFTIHKFIYVLRAGKDGIRRFHLRANKSKNAVIIVDEASMIAGKNTSSKGNWGRLEPRVLLDDLMSFVKAGKNCKLILIGDTAQLPPVHMEESLALNENYLEKEFYLDKPKNSYLRQVIRQQEESGILKNATKLRTQIEEEDFEISLEPDQDVIPITGEQLEEELTSAYQEFGDEGVMVITRSNKRANLFNLQIRARIKWLEDEIAAGDQLMVVKNNYHWLDAKSKAGFIANGDLVELRKIVKMEEIHGFRFATVVVNMLDYPDEPEIECLVILDTLSSETSALTPEQSDQLFRSVREDYMDILDRQKHFKAVFSDKYLNALQVKFGCAITCHKAQGGQWPCVFLDQGYLTDEMINKEYLRWLYTAFTRASEKLYLVNFNEQFITTG